MPVSYAFFFENRWAILPKQKALRKYLLQFRSALYSGQQLAKATIG